MVASASLYFNTPDSRAQAEKTIKTLTELDGMPVRIDSRGGRPYIYGISKGAEEGKVEEGELGVKQEKRRQAQRALEDYGKRDDEQRREGGGKQREGRGEAPGGGALAGEVTRNEAAESGAPIEAVPSSEPATPSTRGVESQAQPSESAPVPPSPAAEALPAQPEMEVKLEAPTPAPEAPIPTESSPAPAEPPKP
ncbi:hypothetical protein BOTBODRAFT_474370 [Botryobasidium botryosum FD-172 SS1]|uniref:Uncharacterized protein n=1 Tax=Botryobasidium botryosum (strain FD-172 SS1) TaxID=930990 RepID=A0A067M832_BOTB1|nr:hypothetical protein BOTBODRAFT_474370 [Botryobasidium botryosum FD-172 SS1]